METLPKNTKFKPESEIELAQMGIVMAGMIWNDSLKNRNDTSTIQVERRFIHAPKHCGHF